MKNYFDGVYGGTSLIRNDYTLIQENESISTVIGSFTCRRTSIENFENGSQIGITHIWNSVDEDLMIREGFYDLEESLKIVMLLGTIIGISSLPLYIIFDKIKLKFK